MSNSVTGFRRFLFVVAVAAFTCAVSLPSGDAFAADAVQARKDIKAMGLEYNGQAFATAAGNGDMTAVQLFLDAGMDVNEGGSAAIGVAAGRGKTEMVKFLLSKGSKATSNALQYARTRGHKDVEQLLVAAGAKE
ncbi:MAG: ankyrin repeat domain-containing protein [Gammaproteobacteria bacterium]|nr:ankyrin repeat domain-containing protein [Gammaproteobacteria bacterium]MBU1481995.1 ankyrin repeat domain-containing protein [Gammaproteobacteria bacterium]